MTRSASTRTCRRGPSCSSNTGSIVTAGNVNDSVGVRLGKVYTASAVTIDNGIDASGNINRNATITTADADGIRPGGVDAGGIIGSSTITNYGTISASDQLAATQLTKDNGVDIGGGQQSTVINYGTIIGDESGLGSDNTASLTFAPTYYVTNNVGATITGNNGPGIAIGNNTSATATSTTSVINNFGTITGKALGRRAHLDRGYGARRDRGDRHGYLFRLCGDDHQRQQHQCDRHHPGVGRHRHADGHAGGGAGRRDLRRDQRGEWFDHELWRDHRINGDFRWRGNPLHQHDRRLDRHELRHGHRRRRRRDPDGAAATTPSTSTPAGPSPGRSMAARGRIR